MTYEEIDELPLLIRRKDLIRLTGWGADSIAGYVQDGRLTPVRPSGRRKGLWRKYEVLQVVGIPFDHSGRVIRPVGQS